jgi:DNA-binding CsgD family transcriptional regulator
MVSAMTASEGLPLDGADPSDSVWIALQLTRAAVQAGDLDAARRWSEFAARRANALALPLGSARALRAEAELALGLGEPVTAVSLAEQAEQAVGSSAARLDWIEAGLLRGRALLAARRLAAGRTQLQSVAAEAGAARAAGLANAAARELRRTGTRISRRAAAAGAASHGKASLSAREREIAELAAEGRTNKEVAATLFLSEKTIENNLSRIYAKLGLRSRTELAAMLASRRVSG